EWRGPGRPQPEGQRGQAQGRPPALQHRRRIRRQPERWRPLLIPGPPERPHGAGHPREQGPGGFRLHFENVAAAPPRGRDEASREARTPPVHQGTILSTNVYVGNIPHDSTAADLRDWFSDFGTVTHARVASDRQTGRPRGFGFVEMADGAENAVGALNGFR